MHGARHGDYSGYVLDPYCERLGMRVLDPAGCAPDLVDRPVASKVFTR